MVRVVIDLEIDVCMDNEQYPNREHAGYNEDNVEPVVVEVELEISEHLGDDACK